MTQWSKEEITHLEPILEQIEQDLQPLEKKQICVLCSRAGEIVFRLAEKMSKNGKIVGLERSRNLLQQARILTQHQHTLAQISFRSVAKDKLPFANQTFDALVSEFIIYPTPLPTEIGQVELARVIKPGGSILLTDVICTQSITAKEKKALKRIGIQYLCDAELSDFQHWMESAGLTNIKIRDFTPLVQRLWEHRAARSVDKPYQAGFTLLQHDKKLKLGEGIFYIYAKGDKPL